MKLVIFTYKTIKNQPGHLSNDPTNNGPYQNNKGNTKTLQPGHRNDGIDKHYIIYMRWMIEIIILTTSNGHHVNYIKAILNYRNLMI